MQFKKAAVRTTDNEVGFAKNKNGGGGLGERL
jgi:hypothetical protein